MQGLIKKIKDIFPVTLTDAVYFKGTSKTLQQAIENGELGGGKEVSVTGRGETMFVLRSGKINIRRKIANALSSNTITYSFPTDDSDRVRRLFVYKHGGSMVSIDIPDGELEIHQALVYNASTNALETRTSQWGSMTCTTDEYILLFNALGNISGLLSQFCDYGSDNVGFPIKEVEAEEVSTTGSTQGIIVIDGTVYTCYHASDDHSSFDGKIGTKTHNICHMNAPEYNQEKDMLIVGNGSKDYALAMQGWIFPSWKTTFEGATQLDINSLDKITLDFTDELFSGEYKAQLCWGYDDYVFLATSDNRYIRKLKLCTGTTQGTYGTYVERTDGGYNGTYEIVGTWYSRTTDTIGGMLYHNGHIYFGVKGYYGIRKCLLKSNGFFDSEYIHIRTKEGDMQGIAIYNNEVYAYSDSSGYMFDVNLL